MSASGAGGWRRVTGLAVALLLLGAAGAAAAVGWLGVRIRDLSEIEMEEISARHGIREGYGVVIVTVLEGSPAARSSLRAGDVVVGFAGRPIVDVRTLQRAVAAVPLDRELTLTVLRREGRQRILVRLAPMPPEITGERAAAEFGFFLRQSSAEEHLGNWLGPMESQSLVVDVLPGSQAERGGLRTGDVLRQVNGEPLRSFRDAALALARMPLDQPLRLVVRRGSTDELPLTLPPPAQP